jgi:hypothetical protein
MSLVRRLLLIGDFHSRVAVRSATEVVKEYELPGRAEGQDKGCSVLPAKECALHSKLIAVIQCAVQVQDGSDAQLFSAC